MALDLEDYNALEGTLIIRDKWNKERLAHVVEGAKDALEDWLAYRESEPGPLFLPVGKGGLSRKGD